jgi:glycosyltransferase involved in cell wall biosynthesis
LSGERSLRVHVLIDSLTWGGAELLLADLAEGARHHDLELSVGYLFAESVAAERLHAAGLTTQAVGIGGLTDLRALPRVRRHLAEIRPDIVHTHLEYADLLGGVAARTLGIPAVATLHIVEPRETGRDRARARLTAFARRRFHRKVIAVSDHIREAYLAAGADRPEHVVTIHNGISVRPEPGSGAKLREELGIGAEEPLVAMISVLREGKGHDLAVGAVEELSAELPGIRLLIAGDGPARDEVESLASRLRGAAVLAGHRDDVLAVLDAADVFLHPTRADVFPTVLLEALAAGTPIVASRVEGVPEIVDDNHTGLLVPPPLTSAAFAEQLRRVFGDPDLARGLADRGQKRFEQEFTADRWAGRLRALYDEVRA